MSMPLHAFFVHFPIALLSIGTLVLIISFFKPAFFEKTAVLLLGIGFVGGIVAYISGEGAEEYAEEQGKSIHSLVETHETLGLISLVIFGVVLLLLGLKQFKILDNRSVFLIAILVAAAGTVVLFFTGHYGGRMVYEVG